MNARYPIVVGIVVGLLFATSATFAQSNTAQEEANIKLLAELERVVVQARNPEAVKDFVAKDYIQHDPNAAPGRDGLIQYMKDEWKGYPPRPVERTFKFSPGTVVIAKGDLVMLMQKRTLPDPDDRTKTYEGYEFNLFRVKNGKFVEHWDDAPKIPKH
jgi:predicted SnoaL-like aldol condensation-catalyzing enzyme